MTYLLLLVAIVAEVVATSALKASEGFTVLAPTLLALGGYGAAFYCLSLVVRSLPVGIAYAVWAGLGTVLIAAVGAVRFHQRLDAPALLGLGLILAGVVVINVFSRSVGH